MAINSAYTKRLEASFKSTNKRTWYVAIYDRNYTAQIVAGQTVIPSFEITDGGLKIQFDSDGDDKFAPIVGSKCIVNIMINYNNSLLKDFMDDIMFSNAYKEGDIMMTIREGSSNGDLIFCGEYLQDLDTLPDVASPFPIQLTFTDGIGKLKEITFESKHVDTTTITYKEQGYKSFAFWIAQALQHTKFFKTQANPDGFWDSAANTYGFRTCCRWYNANMYYSPNSSNKAADPLQQTHGTVKWSDKLNPADGQQNIASAYEVIKQICRSWGMRLISWMGQWHLYQIYEYDNVNTQTPAGTWNSWLNPIDMDTYLYYADGDAIAQTSSMGQVKWGRFNNKFYNLLNPGKRIQKLSGGKYKFVPALNEVKINLIHDGFQNIFPGYATPDVDGSGALKLMGGPYSDSTQFKFKCNIVLSVTPPTNNTAAAVLAGGYYIDLIRVQIIACPAGSTSITQGLATLKYNNNYNTYSWDDTASYTSGDFGPNTILEGKDGPYPYGQMTNVSLGPNLEFPGYRDEPTDYWLHWNDTGGLLGKFIFFNASWNQFNPFTGWPYGSNLIFGITTPINTNVASVPSWSSGVFNNFISTIQPVSENNTTTNTIFVNNQTEDSSKLDWGKVYWGDGPEVWDDSALTIRTGFSTYTYSNPNQANWARRDQNSGLPTVNSGSTFNNLLTKQIKECQAKIIRRANFKTANSPTDMLYFGRPFFVNPIGVIQDLTQDGSGNNMDIRFFFRRGKFDLTTNQWDGEWIETHVGTIAASSGPIIIAGGPNLNGSGNTEGGIMQSMASTSGNAIPKVTLAYATEGIEKDVAITTLGITNQFETDVQSSSNINIGTQFNLKTGDNVLIVYKSGNAYPITLTADVSSESTQIEFNEITPSTESNGLPTIQMSMVHLYENSNRKNSGEIAGFDVSATSLTKGGISIDGFLDSDTMTGASATTLPTSESVKAYVDASAGGGGGLTNYSNLTTSTTSLSADTNGEASGVPIAFDTELASASNSIVIYDSGGVAGIADSAWCYNFGGDAASGYFELIWNITTDVSVNINRVVAGVKLQQGDPSGDTMTWTDVPGTHGFIYNRGSGNLLEGSCSGSTILNLNSAGKLYFRLLLWREGASNGNSKAITVPDGCQISIKQLNL